MILNTLNANERFQLNTTLQNTQNINLTTQNFTILNNDTSFANEQSYCLPRLNNTLNNSAFIEEVTNPNLEQSFQASYQPSAMQSMNPTHRKFIFQNGQISKIKNPSTNRLLTWNEEYIRMTQNQEENNRFYFIKILNPFPSDILQLDQENQNNNLNAQNQNQGDSPEQIRIDFKTQVNNPVTLGDEASENFEKKNEINKEENKAKDITIEMSQQQYVQEISISRSKNINPKEININDNNEQQNDEEEMKQDLDNDENSLENKRNGTEILKGELKQNEIYNKQNILANQKTKVLFNGQMNKQQKISQDKNVQQQIKLSNIFKNSIFQRFTGDSPCSHQINSIEKNKSQQREMRELLREFLSYSDLIPIDLKTTSKWKISRLKRFLFSTELSSCKFAKLIYQGKELRDIDMVYDYRIVPGHVVQAVVQKEEILNQFYTNSERRRLGLNTSQLPNQPLISLNNQGNDNQRQQNNPSRENEGENGQQRIRPSSQIQQQLFREHQQRNIFNYMNQQGFDKLKEQHNISDRDIILQRIYFHSKAQFARDNYQNMSDLLVREEKWLYSNFRKVDTYSKFRNYDFKKDQDYPYNSSFLRNHSSSNQESPQVNIDQEHSKQKLSTHFIQFVCGALLGYILGLFLFLLLYFKLELCSISRTFIYSILAGIVAKTFYLSFQFVVHDDINIFI